MTIDLRSLAVRLALSDDDRFAAARLRYDVFVSELGGTGDGVDPETRTEADRFDDFAEQLVLADDSRPVGEHVVGVYRLMDARAADRAGGFYSAGEYDLAPLEDSGLPLLELGRSCLHREARGSAALIMLWNALADLIEARGIGLLFGVASFHGTDTGALAQPLALLHHRHRAPDGLCPVARPPGAVAMDLVAPDALDRRAAMLAVPPLIKAYLRLGGWVGSGAFVDRAFNTTDVCMVLETSRIPPEALRAVRARP